MLENIRIASPCSADWEKMPGDNRIRHCDACNLNVYNLAAFTEAEIRELVANRKGRLCGRIYQRRDGTVLTQNCPVGMRAMARRVSRIAGAVFAVLAGNFIANRPATAQSYTRTNVSSAGLSVKVIDPSGAILPNVEVTLSEASRKTKIQGKTDKHGRLLLRAALTGHYLLTVSSPYFQTLSQTVELRPGEILSMRVKLDLGLMGEVVAVDPTARPSRDIVPLSSAMPGSSPAPRPMRR